MQTHTYVLRPATLASNTDHEMKGIATTKEFKVGNFTGEAMVVLIGFTDAIPSAVDLAEIDRMFPIVDASFLDVPVEDH